MPDRVGAGFPMNDDRMSLAICLAVLLLHLQVTQNVLNQVLVDLAVPRNRLLLSGLRIYVDVVIAARPEKNTSLVLKFAKQLPAFHVITTSRIW